MPRRWMSSIAVLVAVLASSVGVGGSARADSVHYYLSLGDSLSRGYEPGIGDTNVGYADDLFARLHATDPSLELVKLGCSGETTLTMIDGGKCTDRYPAYPVADSQLRAAERFLREHPGQVTHLTIDIGANDVAGCAKGGSIDAACLTRGIYQITTNLKTILDRLVDAAGPSRPRWAGMTYYDPFLSYWLTPVTGQLLAVASYGLLEGLNTDLVTLYGLHGFQIADAANVFHSSDWVTQRTVAPYGTLPLNVAFICQYTNMCSRNDIHTTPAGYQLLANAFERALA